MPAACATQGIGPRGRRDGVVDFRVSSRLSIAADAADDQDRAVAEQRSGGLGPRGLKLRDDVERQQRFEAALALDAGGDLVLSLIGRAPDPRATPRALDKLRRRANKKRKRKAPRED